jgi:hypothetical protein
MTEYTYVRDEPRPLFYPERFVLRAIDIVIGIVEFLLGVRFVLHLLGASGGNSFMAWLDSTTGQLIAPFSNIFPSWDVSGFVVEFTTLFAMLAYAVIGWLISRLIVFLVGAIRPTF